MSLDTLIKIKPVQRKQKSWVRIRSAETAPEYTVSFWFIFFCHRKLSPIFVVDDTHCTSTRAQTPPPPPLPPWHAHAQQHVGHSSQDRPYPNSSREKDEKETYCKEKYETKTKKVDEDKVSARIAKREKYQKECPKYTL